MESTQNDTGYSSGGSNGNAGESTGKFHLRFYKRMMYKNVHFSPNELHTFLFVFSGLLNSHYIQY